MHLTPGFEEELFNLHVGRVGSGAERRERPHKPLLLVTILDLIATGKARPDRVPWSPELRARFQEYFAIVRAQDDACSPELPFFFLRGAPRSATPPATCCGPWECPKKKRTAACGSVGAPHPRGELGGGGGTHPAAGVNHQEKQVKRAIKTVEGDEGE